MALREKGQASEKKKEAQSPSGACIELPFPALEIQEYLQSHAREERWNISTDQLTEDSWIFSLELDPEAMLRDTVAESRPKGVEWTRGLARAHIHTVQLADGYSRTIIRANFRGFGRSADQFATHREYWELESSNAFEDSLVAALRNHFAPSIREKVSEAPAGL